jgi:hypothetical protein
MILWMVNFNRKATSLALDQLGINNWEGILKTTDRWI